MSARGVVLNAAHASIGSEMRNHGRLDGFGGVYLLEGVYDYEAPGYPMAAAEVGVFPVLGVFLIDCD